MFVCRSKKNCILYKKLLILGSFVVLAKKIFFFFFWLMYQQNCIQKHFWFLYDWLNWLFYTIIFIKNNYFASKMESFVMCNKILYQTVLCLSKKKCMRWYSLLVSIILGFVTPNNSNHCNRQHTFIMYFYICIMLYFCVCQNFVCHTKQVASVPSHHQ